KTTSKIHLVKFQIIVVIERTRIALPPVVTFNVFTSLDRR
ncbi:unnamed protein product, partial [Rotaria sp. Silwood1]